MLRPAAPGDEKAIARVFVASWRSTYEGLLPGDFLDSLSVGDSERRWGRTLREQASSHFVFLAEEGGEAVGVASGGAEREGDPEYRGELYSLYVLPEHHRRGFGRRLVAAVAQRLAEGGMESMLVWVLRENEPARRFYERLGGVYLREHAIQLAAGRRPLEVYEAGYGWRDTARLRSA
jgi:ribosomal protein S18 acetylase RimI-like enzyme